LKNVSKFYNHT